jgi:tetratricopeptide (TPR) repeat protein
LALFQGEWSRAGTFLREAARLGEETGDGATRALALGKAGWVAAETGAREEGTALAEEAVALARSIGEDWVTAEVLNDLFCAASRHALDMARRAEEESLQLRRKLGDAVNIADSLNNLGYLFVLVEEPEQARPLLEESLELARTLGDARHVALAVGNLALVSLFTGRIGEAQVRFAECVRRSAQLGDKRGSLEALLGLAATFALEEAFSEAATLAGAQTGLHAQVGSTPSAGEALIASRVLAPARARFGSERWDLVAAQGATLTLEQATALALQT